MYKIFCDLDGVLADFNKRFQYFSNGILPKDYESRHGLENFWQFIDNYGVEFWSEIEWMEDGKELWDYIKPFSPYILSSPSRSASSKIGKFKWIKKHLPDFQLILAYSKDKQYYAKSNHILIDDKLSNVHEWINRGGIGIHHTSTKNSINQLKNIFED